MGTENKIFGRVKTKLSISVRKWELYLANVGEIYFPIAEKLECRELRLSR